MKKIIPIVIIILIVAVIIFFTKNSKSLTANCSQFSNKDGYTGCNSLKISKTNKCQFKIDNKINESTQQMEFTYTCREK